VSDAIQHTYFDVDGILVRIDTITAHGMSGYGFRLNGRSYTGGGYSSAAAARRGVRAAVRRAIKSQERGRELVERSMRAMRTIGRGPT
jgi:hypothetical protein